MGCGKIRHKRPGAKWVHDTRDLYDYSHTYCAKCYKKVEAEINEDLARWEKENNQDGF